MIDSFALIQSRWLYLWRRPRVSKLLCAGAARHKLAFAGMCALELTACKDPARTSAFSTGIVTITDHGAQLDKAYSNGDPKNAVVLSGAGPLVSYCPLLACVVKPNSDHQRAAALFAAATQDDGHSAEQNVAVETAVRTGISRKWAANTIYNLGENVNFGDPRNSVYRVIKAGKSAATGFGPSGKSNDIIDGTVRWSWINDAAIDSKVGISNEMAIYSGGGESWGQANNVHLQPGATPSLDVNTELDFGNDATDCVFGKGDCYNLIVSTGGTHQSTTALYVISDNKSNYAVHWGLRVAGQYLASDQDIEDDAGAPVGIGLGLFGGPPHQRASIQDNSSGAVSFLITSDHSVATIEDRSNSPASLSIGGRHRIGGIVEQSDSPNGIVLNGNYVGAQIVGKNFLLDPGGALKVKSLTASQGLSIPKSTPSSSHSVCAEGDLRYDREFIYTCVSTNLWRRARLVDF